MATTTLADSHISEYHTTIPMTTVESVDQPSPIVDEETFRYFALVNYSIIGNNLSLFGVTAKAINFIVYVKMGFKDPINVSLVGLSISDFLSCLTMVWSCINYTLYYVDMDLPYSTLEITYLTGNWPHFTFIQIKSCIIMFITFERCMCIIFPLKVKGFITTKFVLFVTVGIYLFVVGLVFPIFYVNRFGYWPNSTILRVVFTEDRDKIHPIVLTMFGTILPIFVFLATILLTIILVQTLRKNAAWREKVTKCSDSGSSTGPSLRDIKIAKMVVLLSLLFIFSFTPVMIASVVITANPEFTLGGDERMLIIVIFSFIYVLELTNASLNIFFYYYRSSNNKAVFDKTFKKSKK